MVSINVQTQCDEKEAGKEIIGAVRITWILDVSLSVSTSTGHAGELKGSAQNHLRRPF